MRAVVFCNVAATMKEECCSCQTNCETNKVIVQCRLHSLSTTIYICEGCCENECSCCGYRGRTSEFVDVTTGCEHTKNIKDEIRCRACVKGNCECCKKTDCVDALCRWTDGYMQCTSKTCHRCLTKSGFCLYHKSRGHDTKLENELRDQHEHDTDHTNVFKNHFK
jgi:hypothetical protein